MKIAPLSTTSPATITATAGPKIDGVNTNGTNTPKLTDGDIAPAPTPRPPIGPKPTFFNVGQYVLDRIAAALADIDRAKNPPRPTNPVPSGGGNYGDRTPPHMS